MKRLISLALILLGLPLWAQYGVFVDGSKHHATAYKNYYYCLLDYNGSPLKIEVDVMSSASVSPLSRNIVPEINAGRATFTIDAPGQYRVRAAGREDLFLFVDSPASPDSPSTTFKIGSDDRKDPETCTEALQKAIDSAAKNGKWLIVPKGTYVCRPLRIPSHSRIWLADGAVLKADVSSIDAYSIKDGMKTRRFIYIKDAEDVTICGRGAIDGSGARLRELYGDKARMRLVMMLGSRNVKIEGVMLRDPGSWNTQILQCSGVTMRNVKVMNDFDISNTDGIDPDASSDILIENCFAYCSDDNIAIKTTGYSGYDGDLDGVTVRNCVFITKKSSLKVGTETRGAKMSNILFENNDVLMFDRGMAIYVSDGADVSDVVFRNNRFEECYFTGRRMMFEISLDRRKPESRLGTIKGVTMSDNSFLYPCYSGAVIRSASESEADVQVEIRNLEAGGRHLSAKDIQINNSKVKIK